MEEEKNSLVKTWKIHILSEKNGFHPWKKKITLLDM